MTANPTKKILLIADSKTAKFYLVENFKIQSLIKELSSEELKIHHARQEKKTGRFDKSGLGSRFLDTHSEAKDLDRKDFCKIIVHDLSRLLDETKYDQLILVCAPKTLGDIRSNFPAKFKDIHITEVVKEITHADISQIEKEVLYKLKFK